MILLEIVFKMVMEFDKDGEIPNKNLVCNSGSSGRIFPARLHLVVAPW